MIWPRSGSKPATAGIPAASCTMRRGAGRLPNCCGARRLSRQGRRAPVAARRSERSRSMDWPTSNATSTWHTPRATTGEATMSGAGWNRALGDRTHDVALGDHSDQLSLGLDKDPAHFGVEHLLRRLAHILLGGDGERTRRHDLLRSGILEQR